MNIGPTDHACPLCGGLTATALEHIGYDDIWAELECRYGARYTSEQIAKNTPPLNEATLMQCITCELQFFLPLLPGDPEFYQGLEDTDLEFSKDRWEFAVARRLITDTDAVVDFGCGDGAFLRSLSSSQRRRVGIDHSEKFIQKLGWSGVEGLSCDFGEFAQREKQRFDVACAFHVVEHLSEVGPLVGAATSCLRPGGRLVISVPNRGRISTDPFPVLDCPPHHVSRWTHDQFATLAAQFGLQLVQVRFELRAAPSMRLAAERGASVAFRAAKSLMARRSTPRGVPPPTPPARLSRSRASRARYVRRLSWGHAMLAEFATAPPVTSSNEAGR